MELGARSILIGQSVARYFIFDGMRALDYLVSRPDVDADRLGVTGCSGGGAITTYLGALDPRIKAAAPGCHINSFRTLFTGPTPDSEMSLPQFLANGLDLADFYELSAPLPWLLMATTEDYFTPAGAKPMYDEVRRWYGLYGAEERVQFFVGQGPHGTPKESREATYRWMIRWLKNGEGDAADLPVKLFTNAELRVTASGNVEQELNSRKLYQVIYEEFRKLRKPRPRAELLGELKRLGVQAKAPRDVQQVSFEVEPGLRVGAKLYLPRGEGNKTAVIVIEEKRLRVPLYVQPSQSTAAIAEALAAAGSIVLEVEPRDSPEAVDGRPFLGNWLTNERADLVGHSLAALRARDILAGVELLAQRTDVGKIQGYARGAKGVWLLMAAAVDPRLGKLWLDRTPVSLPAALEGAFTNNLFEVLIPGFALHWDIPDLAGDREILWTDPTNWMNQVIDAGPQYRYRTVGEPNDVYIRDFLK